MAIDKVLKDLTLEIHPDSNHVTTISDPVDFIVSVWTTSRTNIFLRVDYGDNGTNIVPVKDTNTSGLVLHGDGKDMEIIANYGEGCKLVVEFQHLYEKEGDFKSTITVFRNNLDKVLDNNFEGYQNVITDKLYTELNQTILVIKEIAGIRIESERVGKCNKDTEFSLQFVPSFNLSVLWTIKILDDGDEDVLIEEVLSKFVHLTYKFEIAGAYIVSARASNALSSSSVSTNIVIQCPIEGLRVTCKEEFIATGEELECVAEVESGSNVAFLCLLEGPVESSHVFYENYTSVLRTKMPDAGVYDIRVHAANNISKSLFDIEPPIKVLDPVDHITVYKVSRTLLGNMTDFIGVYQPTNTHVNYDISFDFDFGDGRRNIPATVCEDWMCYVRTSFMFPTPGSHKVLVYGYNEVSEVVEEVEIWTFPGLDNISVEVLDTPVVGHPVKFLLKENGKLFVMVEYHIYPVIRQVFMAPALARCDVGILFMAPALARCDVGVHFSIRQFVRLPFCPQFTSIQAFKSIQITYSLKPPHP